MAKIYEFTAVTSNGRTYTVEAWDAPPTTANTFEGGFPVAQVCWKLKDGTPVIKVADMVYELPDGTTISTDDPKAP